MKEEKKGTSFSPINSSTTTTSTYLSVARCASLSLCPPVPAALVGVGESEDEKGGRGGGRRLWSSVHTSLKTTPAGVD